MKSILYDADDFLKITFNNFVKKKKFNNFVQHFCQILILMKDQTEDIIKQAAKKLFFSEGKFKATTQEIANAAGVNRTLINYYFRSRDNLFNIVFDEAQKQEHEKSESILHSTITFKEKIANYIDYTLSVALEYPYLEIYLVTQINQGCVYKDHEQIDKIMKIFDVELKNEIEQGRVDPIESIQFILNLISMISFPVSMRPLIQESMKLNDKEYNKILSDRKEIILKTLFKS